MLDYKSELVARIRLFASQLWWALPPSRGDTVVHVNSYKVGQLKHVWKAMRCVIAKDGFELVGRIEVLMPSLDEAQAKVFAAVSSLIADLCRMYQKVPPSKLTGYLWMVHIAPKVYCLHGRADSMPKELS